MSAKNSFDVLRFGDVSLEEQRAHAAGFDFLRGLLGALSVAQIVDCDVDLEIGQ